MFKVPIKILLSILVLIIFWSLVTPIFEFPDEQAHIGTVNYLVKEGRVPVGEELDMTIEMEQAQKYLGVFRDRFGNNSVTYRPEYRVTYTDSLIGLHEQAIKDLNTDSDRSTYVAKEAARYPRLYYDFVGIFERLVSGSDLFVRTYAMRLGNVLLAGLTAFFVYRIGLLLFGLSSHATVLTLMVMLQPMYSFLSAGVNSDNLHNLLFTTLIYFGIYHLKYRPTILSVLSGLLILVLNTLTKPQGFIGIPVFVIPLLPLLKKIRLNPINIFIALLYTLVGIVYLHPYYSPYIGLITNSPNLSGSSLTSFVQFSLNKLLAQNIVWYWGVYKWLGVVLPPIYWQLANRLVLFAGVGLIIYFWRVLKRRSLITSPRLVLFLILTSVYYAVMIYWFDWNHVKNIGYSLGVQARYFFPTISAHMALLMIGLLSFNWNIKVSTLILRILVAFIIWMQLGGIWRLITSYYDVSSLQTFITQVSQYKPDFVKGEWWHLWILLYLGSLLYLFWYAVIKSPSQTEPKAEAVVLNSLEPQKYVPKKRSGSGVPKGRLSK